MKVSGILITGCVCLGLIPGIISGKAIPVDIKDEDGRFSLLRDGRPYVIKGAGGRGSLEELKKIGGNSIRTWGDTELEYLDRAKALGLSVCVGMWIDHERHGFDYDDPEAVRQQIERHCAVIDTFKDHPAVLMWGIGNEVELESTNPKVWDVIEAVAAYAKKVDPNHPTMTVIAQAPEDIVTLIKERCLSIDILGCNSYGGITILADSIRDAGWMGPYMVTEWGTNGMWEQKKTIWGAEIEPDSTTKAKQILDRYRIIQADKGRCIGSYVFHWGNKQETTPTWFNLFLKDGERIESVDTLEYLWTGSYPTVLAPRIDRIRLNNKKANASIELHPGEIARASFNLRRSDPDHLRIQWELLWESADKRFGGDREQRPEEITLQAVSQQGGCMEFFVPEQAGTYRLFLYVFGEDDKVATANIPFLVK